MKREIVGLVPAAGKAKRLAPFAWPTVAGQSLLVKLRSAGIPTADVLLREGKCSNTDASSAPASC